MKNNIPAALAARIMIILAGIKHIESVYESKEKRRGLILFFISKFTRELYTSYGIQPEGMAPYLEEVGFTLMGYSENSLSLSVKTVKDSEKENYDFLVFKST